MSVHWTPDQNQTSNCLISEIVPVKKTLSDRGYTFQKIFVKVSSNCKFQ